MSRNVHAQQSPCFHLPKIFGLFTDLLCVFPPSSVWQSHLKKGMSKTTPNKLLDCILDICMLLIRYGPEQDYTKIQMDK